MSNKRNLANGILSLGVNSTDTTWVLENGYGAGMPEVPFYITATPFGQLPTLGNSEIVNVTAMSGDTLTVQRGAKDTTAKAFDAGAVVANAIYADEKWTSENIDWATFTPTTYSLSEQRVGVWTDGKPLYRKSINMGAFPNATYKEVNHGVANIERVVNVYGYTRNPSSGTVWPLFLYASSTTYWYVEANDTRVLLMSGSNRSGQTENIATIEYTKTTD